jgi:N utilization substance protein B
LPDGVPFGSNYKGIAPALHLPVRSARVPDSRSEHGSIESVHLDPDERKTIMSARRIARELAVILMPQLPKDREKLENADYDALISKAVHMLVDYAKQNLADANASLVRSSQALTDIEVEHPRNVDSVEELNSVPLSSGVLKEQISAIERALELVAEALDVPEMALHGAHDPIEVKCRKCDNVQRTYIERTAKSEVREFIISLVSTYLGHKNEVDDLIKKAKAKWNIDRMVSIDRDILRLAFTEAFFMPDVPVNVCISEAVELCHRFADDKAAKFINGILGDMSDEAKTYRRTGSIPDASSVESGSTGGARI